MLIGRTGCIYSPKTLGVRARKIPIREPDLCLNPSHVILEKKGDIMQAIEIVALFIAINLIILFTLTFLVIRQRRRHSIGIGDGNNEDLQRAIRVHGNFTEYTPLAMIALMALAALGAHTHLLWLLGGTFTLGRLMHAIGYSKNSGKSFGRFYGMVLSGMSILAMAGSLLFYVLT
ncbi:MAG TPA: hypothetical protein ENJ42_08595 [Hellea balneolensis]|uniref:Glutathione S-transferase n=1 Tax=Hellea balneolensis TaxID=287478 RepID=A0A7C5QX39_9PROT|nr:hypothetical protein [Hellea balneolensis]